MMALKLLPILQVIVILCSPSYAYPAIYGTKRYGRSPLKVSSNSWGSTNPVQPYQQQMARTQRYPLNYYDMYPYGQNYPDEYYYPHEAMSYPVYYPPARTSKYEVYQAVLPYYYDRPVMRTNFGNYYGYDDSADDVEEEIMQEAEREQREESQPIGHEMYYENDAGNTDNINDVNAAFLQNLIMSQMYKDSLNKYDGYDKYGDEHDDDIYGKLDEYPPTNQQQNYYNEDEDVRELKQLTKPHKVAKTEPSNDDRLHWFQRSNNKKHHSNNYYDEKKRSLVDNRNSNLPFTDRKNLKMSTTMSPSTIAPRRDSRGQKEEVLLRPATPVKHPFSSPVLMNKKDTHRTPSVYDTIKQMLDMEKSLENTEGLKPPMRKRIISSEDSLTHQLSVLKKQ